MVQSRKRLWLRLLPSWQLYLMYYFVSFSQYWCQVSITSTYSFYRYSWFCDSCPCCNHWWSRHLNLHSTKREIRGDITKKETTSPFTRPLIKLNLFSLHRHFNIIALSCINFMKDKIMFAYKINIVFTCSHNTT